MAKKTATASDVDDLLAGKPAPAKKAAVAKTAEKAAPAKKTAAAKSGKKADDVLEGKEAKKAAAAPAKKRAESSTEEIRAALLKCKKLTTYSHVAEAGGFDIRAVRRSARVLRDEGSLEFVKEGTVIFFKTA